MARTWLITDANSGFGRLATQRLLVRGDRVAALVRRPETLDAISASGHDSERSDPLAGQRDDAYADDSSGAAAS